MKANPITELASKIEEHYLADVLIFFGPISRNWDDFLIDVCRARKKRKNVLLLLTTYGGDAHAAYRIARSLRRNYPKPTGNEQNEGQILIFVNGICASAGTLITLAADRLILSDHAELGPVDVQIRKAEEVGENTSGLTPIQALNFLEDEAQKFFRSQFRSLRFNPRLSFSTRMAADISAQLSGGLLSKLYEQIDPLRLAEYNRLLRIAEEYGERIKTDNVKAHTIMHLLSGYPSHDFCIDGTEAKELFQRVEPPSSDLESLGGLLKAYSQKCLKDEETAVFYLTEAKSDEK